MKREDWLNIYKIGRHLGYKNIRMYQWRNRYYQETTNGVPATERHKFVKGAEELGIELTHDKFEEWDKR